MRVRCALSGRERSPVRWCEWVYQSARVVRGVKREDRDDTMKAKRLVLLVACAALLAAANTGQGGVTVFLSPITEMGGGASLGNPNLINLIIINWDGYHFAGRWDAQFGSRTQKRLTLPINPD